MAKKLTRCTADKKLGGVCSGLAKYFDIDPTVARVAYAILTLITGFVFGLLVYVVLALIMPEN